MDSFQELKRAHLFTTNLNEGLEKMNKAEGKPVV
jgi:hypothetical protein